MIFAIVVLRALRPCAAATAGTVLCFNAAVMPFVASCSNGDFPTDGFPESMAELLALRARSGARDSKMAQDFLADARAQGLRGYRGWSASAKYYMESVARRPTVEGLVGVAEATAMMPTQRQSALECEDTKRGLLERSASYYRLAIEFSDTVGESFPDAWPRGSVEGRIACLNQYANDRRAPRDPDCSVFIASAFESCR